MLCDACQSLFEGSLGSWMDNKSLCGYGGDFKKTVPEIEQAALKGCFICDAIWQRIVQTRNQLPKMSLELPVATSFSHPFTWSIHSWPFGSRLWTACGLYFTGELVWKEGERPLKVCSYFNLAPAKGKHRNLDSIPAALEELTVMQISHLICHAFQ
jgi:hypothetical protein